MRCGKKSLLRWVTHNHIYTLMNTTFTYVHVILRKAECALERTVILGKVQFGRIELDSLNSQI
jgi:hypothetical protein